MNPLYQMLTGQQAQTTAMSGGMQFANPIQKLNYIMQAMRNPAAFVKQHIPDIPEAIQNDPNQILQYLQQTRGVTNEQIQQLAQQARGLANGNPNF